MVQRVALQLQLALTAWHELFPEDSDEDACERSLEIVERELEAILARDANRDSVPLAPPPPVSALEVQPMEGLVSATFREFVVQLGRQFPTGFDISTLVEAAKTHGWKHKSPRAYACLAASQLARLGVLTRIQRGKYTLANAG